MKYSEIKKRIKILKKHGYKKVRVSHFSLPVYERIYKLNNWSFKQAINQHDILYTEMDLNDYLIHLYKKSMKLLLNHIVDEYTNSIKF